MGRGEMSDISGQWSVVSGQWSGLLVSDQCSVARVALPHPVRKGSAFPKYSQDLEGYAFVSLKTKA